VAAESEATPRRGPLGLPRTFWVLWLGMLINRLGGGVFPFLSLYLATVRHTAPAAIGLVVGLYATGGLVSGPIGGLLADRWGRRASILAGTALAASAMVALGITRAPGAIAPLAFILGFFTELSRPALQAAVADVVAPDDRRRAYGLLYWAINLGFSGAALGAGFLATWSFPLLFAIDAATTLAYGALVLALVPETRPVRSPTTAPLGRVHELTLPLRDRQFVVFAMIQVLVLLVFQQLLVAFPLDMHQHGLSSRTIGFILAINGLVIVFLQPLVMRFTARAEHRHLLAAGGALVGLGYGFAALAGGAPIFVLASVVLSLGEIGFSIATPALIAHLAPADHRGGYMGANQLIWGLAGVMAPTLGSVVLARFGSATLWIGCAAVALTAAGLHALFTGRGTGADDPIVVSRRTS
jgi:MFS family permease